jgi:FlaA1/EpsC-like NDP-sugar epimerase
VQRYGGKRVMVTGAGGSIGSELCRQLAFMRPAQLILAERDETNLFEIERELMAAKVSTDVVPLLLDVMDGKQVEKAFRDFQPQVVFHAAAYKHVPMMERFPWEAVRNNVFATKQLAELAEEHGVESFVMISTDKAINPTSVMGATKRFAEQIVQVFAAGSKTRFSCVRFGNVLGSRGSVVGIFQDQIANGGPVTVTHPDATRYFMTIPEAANLVIQAGTLGARGEVFLLDMGEPVRIIDLARQMIRLSGFTEKEIPIKVIGTRPGEKLFEELSATAENLAATELRKIFRCKPVPLDTKRLEALVERLQFVVRGRDGEGVRAVLAELDIGYRPPTPGRSSDVQ